MNPPIYDRKNPFLASVKDRYPLCKPGSMKDTRHVVLDLSGSGIVYQSGDSIGVFPQNDPDLVKRTLEAFQLTGLEEIKDKKGRTFLLREFLSKEANLKGISRSFLKALSEKVAHGDFIRELLADEASEGLKVYCHERHVWDLVEEHPEATFLAQELVNFLMPMLPRFYSIASSQEAVGEEVHFTVSHLRYLSRGVLRVGVCTHYLCESAPMHESSVPVFLQTAKDFHLPLDPEIPIIMIGPGTGVAPYRAFMQEREKSRSKKNWLFFGEWTRSHEFFYEEEWLRWEEMGALQMDLAFSRDQKEKIYVQHRMEEKGVEFFRWIKEGAIVYVCGDAHRMAKDVEAMLLKIIAKEGGLSEGEAHHYLKELRKQKRYLRDVY
jgi:sulfite reductase (NADPH) flavoprotein alpha-component